MEKLRFAVIGCGNRGRGILKHVLLKMSDVEVVAVCDTYADRVEDACALVEGACGKRPFGSVDFNDILALENVDAVYVATSWETHVEIAIESLKAGKPTAMEVGGAYDLQSLWTLVYTWEETKVPFMMMENCCFGKTELLATALVRHGILGDVVHCHGAYGHFLGEEVAGGEQNRHYRLRNYLSRNCDNYPTHDLGPIAKLLNINRGNRMVSLVSVASRAAGIEAYVSRNAEKYPELAGKKFRQGDVVNTIITCSDGSTISLKLDTCLPRYYSREFTVQGTLGMYNQDNHIVYLDGEPENFDTISHLKTNIGNAERYEEEYLPDCWQLSKNKEFLHGHGGMDGIEFRAFVDALRNGEEMPVDVYDAAAWMSITTLSEASIAAGGLPQSIPDFTHGLWTLREPKDVVKL